MMSSSVAGGVHGPFVVLFQQDRAVLLCLPAAFAGTKLPGSSHHTSTGGMQSLSPALKRLRFFALSRAG